MIVRTQRAEVRGGFTLMEMLVVVAIIVLLAALAAPIVMGRLEEAKKSKAQVDCKTLVDQAKMFKLKYGDFPQTLGQLTQPGADGSAPFIEARYLIDPWGHEYQYTPFGQHNQVGDPEVWSMGPNMQNPNSMVGSWQ
ncbi:MAG TPA: type II secretion system protein GspG [Gemmataceae bacterium]|nr:type II secretion system protein GspG [Gemmataceae bacterium]